MRRQPRRHAAHSLCWYTPGAITQLLERARTGRGYRLAAAVAAYGHSLPIALALAERWPDHNGAVSIVWPTPPSSRIKSGTTVGQIERPGLLNSRRTILRSH